MKQFFTKDVKDENHILKNSEQKKFFIESTNENNSIKIPLISYFSICSDNQSNFTLNSCSCLIDNPPNESNHISNSSYYNNTEENSYISNKENNKKTFLGKKTKIHFGVLKNCEKKRIFETRIFYGKNLHNIEDITLNNLIKDKNILNRQNSESSVNTYSIKETKKK